MVTLPRLAPATLEFVLLSFEGPDQYAMAGGLGVRVKELALELARQGYSTHLIFVGDPHLPPQETPAENLTLYRWSQWLSAHYPAGVYHGEEAKLVDWNEQLPSFVASRLVAPAAARGRLTAILAEEWHTAYATCQLSDQLWDQGLRDKALILWNANNVMGFDRINWPRLDFCSQLTTVSRYMKHVMWERSVNPLVIPNGIPGERVRCADPGQIARLRAAFPGRELIFKIGRFSPDKRWNMAVEAMAEEKRRGRDVATVIRGGMEPHGVEVLANARAQGLTVVDVMPPRDPHEAIAALAAVPAADIYNVSTFMSDELISLLYAAADAVLANSGHEPFGLVGLEVMAAAGVAFVGSTGEDYAVQYLNSVVLDTDDPTEINIALDFLRAHPEVAARIREEAQETARSYSWENVIADNLLGKLAYVSVRQLVSTPQSVSRAQDAGPAAEQTALGQLGAAPVTSASPEAPVAVRPPAPTTSPGTTLLLGATTSPKAATSAATTSPSNPRSEALPYGGQSVSRRLSITPQAPPDCSQAPGQSSDPGTDPQPAVQESGTSAITRRRRAKNAPKPSI